MYLQENLLKELHITCHPKDSF